LALSEIKIGMVPATIAPYVVRTIGGNAARLLFMTDELVNAE
jgi:methylglutaconyl-CoA hydratase